MQPKIAITDTAQPSVKNALLVLLAGFTKVLVTRIPIKWINVSDNPIANLAKPIPNSGNPAANTALSKPPRTSQSVSLNSTTIFFILNKV